MRNRLIAALLDRRIAKREKAPVATVDLGDFTQYADDEIPDDEPNGFLYSVGSLQTGDLVSVNRGYGFAFVAEVESNDGTWITTTEGDRYLIGVVDSEITGGRVTVSLIKKAP